MCEMVSESCLVMVVIRRLRFFTSVSYYYESHSSPRADGYEVAHQIKTDPALRSIPIIAATSHALNGEEQTARAAGCDDYVPEPYSPRQLLAKIRQYMPQ
jgi:response regulator RpfG family c-di-GMP phosphodiesterase